ncbi:NUDIX hydrolase [Actinokineospora enzanensis]|uniref:NUDIX hydrolase n=1 Tax=Actinokineospora enzanensis TaxID=155975 RepID=UPI0003AA1251
MARTDYYQDPDAPTPNSLVVAVSVYVTNESGEILLIRRVDNDLYSIPGGGQEPGETLSQTAVRETKEETGIDIRVTGLVGLYSDPAHIIAYTDGEVRQEFSICFRAVATGGRLETSSESKEVGWSTPGDIEQLTMHHHPPAHRARS